MTARSESPASSTNGRVALLAGQAFSLGLTAAWIAIPASAIFLETYGSGLLPLTYIGAAVAGAVTSAALGKAVRRRPLVSVAMSVLAVLATVLTVSWLMLWLLGANWLSFVLLVLVPIVVPVGFMLIVAQAGMLLDVRALKSLYGRVIAGFASGFVAGGVAGPILISTLGSTEHLLAGGAVAAAMFMVLVSLTRRRYTTELTVVEEASAEIERPTLGALLRHRYVVLIVGFQMLSAVESQWLDFLVFDRAGKRYTDTDDLARFISQFVAIAYGADIIFLLLVAGALMSRFGLRYGLTANPVAVLVLLGSMIAAATLQGSGATIVFVLVVATRVSDLVLADGAARTSLSAAYQAVPTRVRLSAQAAVEGLAVPVAIGVSGVILMLLRSTIGTDGLALPVATSAVVVAWTVVALFVYRDYKVNLLANLRHRSLDPAELTIESTSTLDAIHRLIDSTDERDVRLGLDTLASVDHADLPARLKSLALDERVGLRADVLDRLVRVAPDVAAAVARDGLGHPSAEVRTASVRALGSVGVATDLPSLATCLNDHNAEVQTASVTAMLQLGDQSVERQIADRITALSSTESPGDLIAAARILGASELSTSIDRRLLSSLLGASDHDVVNAGLGAIRWPHDRGLFRAVVGHLNNRLTAAGAVEALARGGDDALVYVNEGLRGDYGLGLYGSTQLTRLCRVIGGSDAAAVLRAHAGHRDREIGLAVLSSLAAIDAPGDEGSAAIASKRSPRDETVVVQVDLEHASHVLSAIAALETAAAGGALRSALSDELALLRRRVLAILSIRYGRNELGMVEHQLAQPSARIHALAMEWLDVTLVGIDRATVSLLEPEATAADRLAILTKWFPISPTSTEAVLVEIVDDPDDRWRSPWLAACAVLAGAEMPELGLEELAESTAERVGARHPGDHTHVMRETIQAIRSRRTIQPA